MKRKLFKLNVIFWTKIQNPATNTSFTLPVYMAMTPYLIQNSAVMLKCYGLQAATQQHLPDSSLVALAAAPSPLPCAVVGACHGLGLASPPLSSTCLYLLLQVPTSQWHCANRIGSEGQHKKVNYVYRNFRLATVLKSYNRKP